MGTQSFDFDYTESVNYNGAPVEEVKFNGTTIWRNYKADLLRVLEASPALVDGHHHGWYESAWFLSPTYHFPDNDTSAVDIIMGTSCFMTNTGQWIRTEAFDHIGMLWMFVAPDPAPDISFWFYIGSGTASGTSSVFGWHWIQRDNYAISTSAIDYKTQFLTYTAGPTFFGAGGWLLWRNPTDGIAGHVDVHNYTESQWHTNLVLSSAADFVVPTESPGQSAADRLSSLPMNMPTSPPAEPKPEHPPTEPRPEHFPPPS